MHWTVCTAEQPQLTHSRSACLHSLAPWLVSPIIQPGWHDSGSAHRVSPRCVTYWLPLILVDAIICSRLKCAPRHIAELQGKLK